MVHLDEALNINIANRQRIVKALKLIFEKYCASPEMKASYHYLLD